MISKIKNFILAFSLLFVFAGTPAMVYAAPTPPDKAVCAGASTLQIGTGNNNAPTGGTDCTTADQTNKVNNLISTILNVLSVIVGIIAVVMIIIGGFHYITSGGSDEKVKKAKNTLLYAIIGLVVVALAQIIVKFVLQKATQQ